MSTIPLSNARMEENRNSTVIIGTFVLMVMKAVEFLIVVLTAEKIVTTMDKLTE